jgi:hypothetical protein
MSLETLASNLSVFAWNSFIESNRVALRERGIPFQTKWQIVEVPVNSKIEEYSAAPQFGKEVVNDYSRRH